MITLGGLGEQITGPDGGSMFSAVRTFFTHFLTGQYFRSTWQIGITVHPAVLLSINFCPNVKKLNIQTMEKVHKKILCTHTEASYILITLDAYR